MPSPPGDVERRAIIFTMENTYEIPNTIDLAIEDKLGELMQFCKGDKKAWENIQDLIKLLNLRKKFISK